MVHSTQPTDLRPLRIALIGSRGIPACYGGYETLMQELSTRLAARGHRVTVYCRSHYTPRHLQEFEGVELVVLPTIRTKHLDTPIHTLLSCLHAAQRDFDVALVVNGVNAFFVPLLSSAEIPVALHVDGIERQRAKWGRAGRTVYALSERLATRVPAALITDAEVVRNYYQSRWGVDSELITYGVTPRPEPAGTTLEKLGLESRSYFLYVSRFEPENNPHRVAEAYRRVPGEIPLVMVGGAPYANTFVRSFRDQADPRIVFPGPIYGRGYRELLSHALAYIHATEVGGTHPALVEAMGYGNAVVVNDTPENREVADSAAIYFRADDVNGLTAVLTRIGAGGADLEDLRSSAHLRARDLWSWRRIVDSYEDLLVRLAQEPNDSKQKRRP